MKPDPRTIQTWSQAWDEGRADALPDTPEAQDFLRACEAARDGLRARPAPDRMPSAAQMWAQVEPQLAGTAAPGWAWLWRLASATTLVVAAAGLGLWLGTSRDIGGAEVAHVESDVPGAGSMVYRDAESGMMIVWLMVPDEPDGGGAGS